MRSGRPEENLGPSLELFPTIITKTAPEIYLKIYSS
jgi:hypothetical protein